MLVGCSGSTLKGLPRWPSTGFIRPTQAFFAVVEVESIEPLAAIRMEWDGVFEIDVFPVVTAEEGLERLRRTMLPEQG